MTSSYCHLPAVLVCERTAQPRVLHGPFLVGVLFQVTTGSVWFERYWWWVCNTGQSTVAQTFTLWAVYDGGVGALIPAATVKSDTLAGGQWNYVPLVEPLPLTGASF